MKLKIGLGLIKIKSKYLTENDKQMKSTVKMLKEILKDIETNKNKSKYIISSSKNELEQMIKSIHFQQESMSNSINQISRVEGTYHNFILNQLTFVLSLIGIGTLVHSFYPDLKAEFKILTIIISGIILYLINLWTRADYQFIIEGHLSDYNYARDIEYLQNKILVESIKYKK
ncbi:MAG: hypothetical protein KC589_11155 [Nanoarchaeota archaeon]|nr:hypothetical protein [Nanoarchaeota archaeon]